MPRPRPPHLQRHKTRHGGFAWYVQIGNGPLIRIRGEYGLPEFMARYEAAVRGEQPPEQTNAAKTGSLAWLIARYRDTGAWTSLSLATSAKTSSNRSSKRPGASLTAPSPRRRSPPAGI